MSESKEEKAESEIQQVAACTDKVETDENTKTIVKSKKTNGSNKLTAKKKKPVEGNPVRGLPKSGRPWKTPKKKFSTIKKSTQKSTFEQKMELRNEIRHIKEMSREIKAQRKEAAVQKNQRRIENAERRLANERRAEIVQVIKNPSKLKRMKKKQMRMIEKRDISQVKVV